MKAKNQNGISIKAEDLKDFLKTLSAFASDRKLPYLADAPMTIIDGLFGEEPLYGEFEKFTDDTIKFH